MTVIGWWIQTPLRVNINQFVCKIVVISGRNITCCIVVVVNITRLLHEISRSVQRTLSFLVIGKAFGLESLIPFRASLRYKPIWVCVVSIYCDLSVWNIHEFNFFKELNELSKNTHGASIWMRISKWNA